MGVLTFNFVRLAPAWPAGSLSGGSFENESGEGSYGWQLCLQASLDGESLEPEMELALQTWPGGLEVQSLLGELILVKSVLVGNEVEHQVPQTRTIYWSEIQRAITGKAETEKWTGMEEG